MTAAMLLPIPPLNLIRQASLFLDFDGTLAEIAAHPRAVVVDERLRSLLACLVDRLSGRLGIISGRPVNQLQQLIGLTSVMFGGSHGAELLWPDGKSLQPLPTDGLDVVNREFRRLQKVYSGLVIERKPFGVALHYRSEPTAEAAARQLATALAASSGLALQVGKMVFELRTPGADKGGALRALMEGPAMAGTLPIFVGDDETDEAAFATAADLGGAGILVGPMRPTAARYRLDDVAATLGWLTAVCEQSL